MPKGRVGAPCGLSCIHGTVSGKGICPFLIDATHQQNYKEAILAYFFIWQGKAESIDELDCECEEFLERLGDTVDFEVSDAVEKLTRDGLMIIDGPIAVNTCVKLADGNLKKSKERVMILWQNLFADEKNIECPICSLLGEQADGAHHTKAD